MTAAVAEEALGRADRMVVAMARLTARLRPRPDLIGGATPLAHLAGLLAKAVYAPALAVLGSQGRLGSARLGWLGQEDAALLAEGPHVPYDLPTIFTWVLSGRFAIWIGPAQIDRLGNTNISRIGPAARPRPALVGSRGLPDDSVSLPAGLYYTTQHGPRSVVAAVDFVSGVGDRRRLPAGSGARGRPAYLVTDLGVFDFGDADGGMRVVARMPGIAAAEIAAATPFPLAARATPTVAPPTGAERRALAALDPLGVRALECVRDAAEAAALRRSVRAREEAELAPRAAVFLEGLGLGEVAP